MLGVLCAPGCVCDYCHMSGNSKDHACGVRCRMSGRFFLGSFPFLKAVCAVVVFMLGAITTERDATK